MIRSRPQERSMVRALATAGLLGLAVAACGSPAYVDRSRPGGIADEVPPPIVDAVVFENSPALEAEPPGCVAVLPFTDANAGVPPDAETQAELESVRRAFHAHLAPRNRRVVALWRIDAVLAAMSVSRRDDRRALGAVLGCDSLLAGSVTSFGRVFLGLYSRVQVGANVRLIRARDGVVLWQGSHRASSHGGSVPISIPGIAFGVIDAAANMRDEQPQRVAEDLARRLVGTIPDTPAPESVAPETLRALAALGALRAGMNVELGDFATAAGN